MTTVEAVEFDDAEAAVITYLNPFLPGELISTKIPTTRPARFLRVMRTGGPRENLVTDRPMISIEAWADKETDAITLLSTARAWLNAADGHLFGVVEASGPVNLPDPTTAQTRYTMSVWIRVRGTVITA